MIYADLLDNVFEVTIMANSIHEYSQDMHKLCETFRSKDRRFVATRSAWVIDNWKDYMDTDLVKLALEKARLQLNFLAELDRLIAAGG